MTAPSSASWCGWSLPAGGSLHRRPPKPDNLVRKAATGSAARRPRRRWRRRGDGRVTGLLPRIERVLEGVVEGGSRRLFRQPLQPIELAKAAARAMQAHPVVGTEGLEVPSSYRVR